MFNERAAAVLSLALVAVSGKPLAAELHLHHETSHTLHPTNEPVGVMGAHTHHEGNWMFSYRWMHMRMQGNRAGTKRLSASEVLGQGYMVAPTRMTMDMHMFGAMYGVSDDLTLMLMLPWLDMEMEHVTGMGGRFTTEAGGVGDVTLGALYRLGQWGSHQLHLNAGLGLPTGSIDEQDDTPMGTGQHLPYPMQTGSGTYDILPGITWLGRTARLSWGAQALATIRLGENDNDYTLGDRYRMTAWVSHKGASGWGASLRLDAQWWDDIEGRDSKLAPMMAMMVPTADPDLRGGERLDLLLGLGFSPADGIFKGHRLAAEWGRPLHQDLNGPQLETDWTLTIGWQYPL
jgi:hypothetical protein